MAVSRVFWCKNLKPVVVSLKPGVFGGVEAEGLQLHQNSRFQWIPPQVFKFLSPKTREYRHFSSEFHWISSTKNKKIWACFHWNRHLVTFGQIFGHEYHLYLDDRTSKTFRGPFDYLLFYYLSFTQTVLFTSSLVNIFTNPHCSCIEFQLALISRLI